jgi:hypothetical protein
MFGARCAVLKEEMMAKALIGFLIVVLFLALPNQSRA